MAGNPDEKKDFCDYLVDEVVWAKPPSSKDWWPGKVTAEGIDSLQVTFYDDDLDIVVTTTSKIQPWNQQTCVKLFDEGIKKLNDDPGLSQQFKDAVAKANREVSEQDEANNSSGKSKCDSTQDTEDAEPSSPLASQISNAASQLSAKQYKDSDDEEVDETTNLSDSDESEDDLPSSEIQIAKKDSFNVGDVVWGKARIYAAWPCKVTKVVSFKKKKQRRYTLEYCGWPHPDHLTLKSEDVGKRLFRFQPNADNFDELCAKARICKSIIRDNGAKWLTEAIEEARYILKGGKDEFKPSTSDDTRTDDTRTDDTRTDDTRTDDTRTDDTRTDDTRTDDTRTDDTRTDDGTTPSKEFEPPSPTQTTSETIESTRESDTSITTIVNTLVDVVATTQVQENVKYEKKRTLEDVATDEEPQAKRRTNNYTLENVRKIIEENTNDFVKEARGIYNKTMSTERSKQFEKTKGKDKRMENYSYGKFQDLEEEDADALYKIITKAAGGKKVFGSDNRFVQVVFPEALLRLHAIIEKTSLENAKEIMTSYKSN